MSSPTTSQPSVTIGLSGQLAMCVTLSALAVAIMFFSSVFSAGKPLAAMPMPIWQQCLAGIGLGGLGGMASYLSYRHLSHQGWARRTIESYSRLDLSGMNPLWFSLTAGIGEELLFRAALQPLLGIWLTSLLFLVAHAPVYKFRALDRASLVQAGLIFLVSMLLGLVFEYVGLVAAMIVHAALDIVALYALRSLIQGRAA